MHPAEAQAATLIAQLAAQGVTEFVVCPGSRSAPLAYAVHAAAARGAVRLHVRIDERSAAFTALGLAMASGRPAAVVTTSGTATANLHPAVLEASHSGVPLIALTADRPPWLRGVGANQATDQRAIYGSAVRLFDELAVATDRAGQVAYWRDAAVRAVAAADGSRGDPGPVHLNLPFTEPLTPATDPDAPEWPEPLGVDTAVQVRVRGLAEPYELPPEPSTVVLAGAGAGRAATALAEAAGWPLFAEPSSGARFGPSTIGPYRLLLPTPLADAIRRVVVFGRPTLSRPVTQLTARADIDLVIVSDTGQWPDVSRRTRLVVPRVVAPPGSPQAGDWLTWWRRAAADATRVVSDVLEAERGLTGPAVAAMLDAALPADCILTVGSSNPIRDLDLVADPANPAALSRDVFANRGLAGIDGAVSTAVGVALASPGRPAYALLGDLTFLHDVNGLLIGPTEPHPNLTVIVLNDRGGGIFSTLEPGAPAYSDTFERIFGTPHAVDLGALSAAYGARHIVATTRDELAAALAPPHGVTVVEVPVSRANLRGLHERLSAAVAHTVGSAGVAGSSS
jgi:2-succinyl-5-enolpyruvyl-6-hydroxy-3-cyclohexene-1-carboxylate synthase